MNISQRLRQCARHTGLDAVIELLQEAADEIDALQARAQVQGEPATVAVDHFDNGPFEAYTNRIHPPVEIGTKLYTTPQPAQATQAEVTDSMIREAFLANGFTIKDGHSDLKPYVYAAARAILSLRPERVPMTEEEIFNAYCKSDSILSTHITNLVTFAKAIEAHHDIKPKEQA